MSYIFGEGTGSTYEDLQKRRELVKMLAEREMSKPQDPWSGMRYLGQSIMKRMAERRKRDAESEYNSSARAEIDRIFGGGIDWGGSGGSGGDFAPASGGVENAPPDALGLTDRDEALSFGPEMSLGAVPKDLRPMASDRDAAPKFPGPAAAGDIGQYAAAIRTIESGSAAGDYQARGPEQDNGDQALGAYQVMRSNLPQWSRDVLGREVTEAEFLATPEIQDAIFQAKFGENVAKYGNPYDAASIWFTGKPRASAGNVSDSLGTTAPAYLQKFETALGSVSGGQGAGASMTTSGSAFKPLEVGGNVKGVDPSLVSRTAEAWAHVIPGARIEVTTGVSNHSPVNHAPGHAIDYKVIRPDGSVVKSSDPEAVQAAMIGRAMGINGVGFGPGYMGGTHMHWDISRNGPRTWGDDDGTASDRMGAGSAEIAARIASATGRPVQEVLAELSLGAGNTTMGGGGGSDMLASGGGVSFSRNPNTVDLMPMASQPTMRPPSQTGQPATQPGVQPPAQRNGMDPTPNFDGALVQKLMAVMQTAGPAMSPYEKQMVEAILKREMGQPGGPMYTAPEPVKPQTMSINGRIVQVYPDGRVQEIYDSNTPEAPGAPEIKDVTLPDGRKVTMQWDGQQYVPIAAPEGMPGPAAGGDPLTAIAKLNADRDAGRITPEQHSAAMARELASKGMRIVADGKGGFTIEQGAFADDSPRDISAPSSPGTMLRSIEGILNDPALDWSVGWSQFMTRIPGTQAARVGARLDQLQGQTFLQAFESLKGGGQITEIEGQKAEAAIGRLNRNQSPADYRAALEDLQAVLKVAIAREEGRAGTPTPPPIGADNPIMQMTLEELRNVDLTTATTEELDAWEARWREVNQ